ncbi:MAG: RHS repeat protein, partial [Acidimicrobiales bacterium]|nr:RHS repeat protein [Acidimicrobiales bacterium]
MTNTYDDANRVFTQTTETGEVDTFHYAVSGLGVTTTVDHGDGSTVETMVYQHDASGRLVGVVDPYMASSAQSWSGDLPVSTTERGGAKSTAIYNSAGVATAVGLADPLIAGAQAGSLTTTYCGANDPRPVDVADVAGVVTRYWWSVSATSPIPCDVGRSVPVRVTHAYGTAAAWDTTYSSLDGLVTSSTDAPSGDSVTTTYNWNSRRQLDSTVDYPSGTANPGRVTYFGYDSAGRLQVRRDPSGVETWTVHDAAGNITTQIGPVAVSRTACALPATVCSFSSQPTSPSKSWVYNLDGSVRSFTDELGNVTTTAITYPSGGGRIETVSAPTHGDSPTNPSSMTKTVTVSTYNRFDRLTSQVVGDPDKASLLATTSFAYDPLGRLHTQSRRVGGSSPDLVTSYAYDADGNQTVTAMGSDPTNTDRQLSKQRYDLRGRLVEQWGPTGDSSAPASVTGAGTALAVRTHETFTYDNADRLLAQTSGDGADQHQTFYRYDDAGRLRYVIVDRDNDGVVSSLSTGGPTDPDDGVTQYTYTPAGRVASVIKSPVDLTSYDWSAGTQSLKRTTTLQYDKAGQNTKIIDARNRATTRTFTARGELLRSTLSGGYYTQYGYDPAGRVIKVTNPSPTGTGTVEVVTSYDARGKVTAKTNPHTPATPSPPAVTYSYWPDG